MPASNQQASQGQTAADKQDSAASTAQPSGSPPEVSEEGQQSRDQQSLQSAVGHDSGRHLLAAAPTAVDESPVSEALQMIVQSHQQGPLGRRGCNDGAAVAASSQAYSPLMPTELLDAPRVCYFAGQIVLLACPKLLLMP